ncbi:uncharacterized protein DUF3515 [Diaminobutyricimonas aerilata]|uniref:Uncharacterized protein DUF3515 n=1 Tax=Diaminobutyricimonas aerilata TaxID=1162967 RepID=A0A2M9CIK3_9MICO|nr:DUF3515 family protein [Diaminobutyricimonas aerilata]PJJ71685.1 uncharacterized protein DUF3515 [Diaminobutyricimonas aerilata]
MNRPRRATALGLALLSVAGLAGCTSTVSLEAAEYATDPACAAVTVWLPETVDELSIRETDAQATGAWGDPASVLLRCGVEPPAPSTLPCVTVEGISWLRDDADDPTYVFTTYGREPAVQVVIDSDKASGGIVLSDLARAVQETEAVRECVDPVETL